MFASGTTLALKSLVPTERKYNNSFSSYSISLLGVMMSNASIYPGIVTENKYVAANN